MIDTVRKHLEAPLDSGRRQANYQTHRPRWSDARSHDEFCIDCGAKNYLGGVDELSTQPCSQSQEKVA
jgi:hypothetical protein